MEQAQYWRWMKRREILKSDFRVCRNSISDSWEEKAFAEDASGNFGGGCIWPPRSYSCSFCKREFRSAQALGGHMNVHRRDRARLKQFDHPTPQNQNPTQSFDSNFPDIEVSGTSDQNSDLHSSRVLEIKRNSKSEMKNPREDLTYDDEFVETDLLMSFNNSACKRAKKTAVSGFSFLIKKPCLSERFIYKPEIRTNQAASSSIEGIDLELRLG